MAFSGHLRRMEPERRTSKGEPDNEGILAKEKNLQKEKTVA